MKKRILAVLLALCLCLSIIPVGTIQAAADVNEGGGNSQEMPAPQNVQATFIGFVDPTGRNAVVVEISWDKMAEIDGSNKFVEMWPALKENANLSLPMSFEAWLGQATLIPVAELQEGGYGYVTENGRSRSRSVVHILQPGEQKVDENGMACGVKENDVIDIDLYTAGWDPATQTDSESEHKHVEIVYTEENVRNKKTFKEPASAECTHENQESAAEVLNVKGNVTIDGKTTGVALIKDTEECKDCHQKKTKKVYRLRFKSRKQMYRYLSGRYAKLKNGKSIHFKGKYEKIEKVFWNKKHIKISKAYHKKKGSVILDFTDEFLASVEDGTHELTVCNGDEFTAMTVTVQDHKMTELGAYDIDDSAEVTADQYEALMQECEENGIEVVDCDLDAFYAGGFMVNADDREVTMNLSKKFVISSGSPLELPSVTLTSDTGVEYAEGEDYMLTYYQVVDGIDGGLVEVEIAKEDIKDIGTYIVAAVPANNGVLSGEAWTQFAVFDETAPLLGDVDGDGEVSIIDATFIQRWLSNIPIPFVLNQTIADTDADGDVTIADATIIQRRVVHLNVPEGIGQPVPVVPEPSEQSVLVGSWSYEEDENFVYTFNADGTGAYTVYGQATAFTYTDNGSTVEIIFDDAPGTFPYTVSGNTLTIKDSTGENVKYIKK